MVIHIIKNDNVPIDICEQLAHILSKNYSSIIRIINYTDVDTILKCSTSNCNIYVEISDTLNMTQSDIDLHVQITESSNLDEVLGVCNFDSIIPQLQEETYWCQNEKGWWYNVKGEQYGGIHNIVTCINGIWYNIGEDYYMKTGWQPVMDEDEKNETCMYFNPEDGRLVYDKDKSDMPHPSSFSYKPAVTKYNIK